ncbi:MAG TPA: aldo/keto reductase [Armatimonadota bacterium]|nr:aldo/keto reductase [Armatimonadota bacterium]
MSQATASAGLATAGLAGIGVLTLHQKAEAAELVADRVGKLERMKLGTRMGAMEVSRVLISTDWNRDLYAPALALGANFVHKAGYWKSMPAEFQGLPRDSYYTDLTVDSTPNNPDNEDQAYQQVVTALDRTGLKYFDIFRAHFGWHSVDAFKNQTGTYKAFQRLKREGKVKYFGVSQHSHPENYPAYPEIIQAEIDSGIIDSMQVWMSATTTPDVIEVFAKAHKAGIGMTAMKTVAHGLGKVRGDADIRQQMGAPDMPGRACVRYSLSATSPISGKGPIFHCCVLSLFNLENFEENVGAATVKTAAMDGFIHNV